MANLQPEIAFEGRVTVSTRCNLRQGAPSTTAPVVRKLESGTTLVVMAMTVGEEIQKNSIWYKVPDASFIWSGGCSALQGAPNDSVTPAPAPAPSLIDTVTPLKPVGVVANVVDLYHGDAVASFTRARNAGVLGIIHKATTGATGRDDEYRSRRPLARDAGLLWGAYHWGTAADAELQVDNFLNWADPDENTLVALDFERNVGNQMSLARAKEFLQIIEERIGRKPVIYSGNTIKEALGRSVDAFFGGHRLWLAEYSSTPHVQASWKAPWLWQFTGGKSTDPNHRSIPGLPGNAAGELDCNTYSGDLAALQAEWAS